MKSTWYNIDNMDDTEIQAFICEIDSKVESCEERFSGDLNFPIVKRLQQKKRANVMKNTSAITSELM